MSVKPKTNPNKVNQHTAPDPRQALFLQKYLDPKSKTFSNALQSGIEAGYTEEYSKSLLAQMPSWLYETINKNTLLNLAEKRLKQYLELEPVNEEGKVDNGLMTNQFKAMQLVLKGIGKDTYSERQEVTGKDGGAIQVNSLRELSTEELLKLSNE